MMTTTAPVAINNAAGVAPSEGIAPGATATNTVFRPHQRVPAFVPRDELFYWTRAWQEGEQESAAEREAGNLRTFETPGDLFRWLLSDEDSDED